MARRKAVEVETSINDDIKFEDCMNAPESEVVDETAPVIEKSVDIVVKPARKTVTKMIETPCGPRIVHVEI